MEKSRKKIFVFSSDWHLGLVTAGIDRRHEIIGIAEQIVSHCKKIQDRGDNVTLVLGGDLFETHDPGEDLIALFIQVMNMLKNEKIETYIIVGNHEAVADPDRLSCLSFLHKTRVGYENIELIDTISAREIGETLMTFLPHVTKATLAHLEKGDGDKFDSTQDYINKTCNKIMAVFGKKKNIKTHIVFSHLNVKGCHPGSEENLLRKSEVFLPNCFTNTQPGMLTPTIINGHIHENQSFGDNGYIVGSPIFCSFGEKYNKVFAEITVGNTVEVNLIETNFTPFRSLDLQITDGNPDIFKIKELQDFVTDIRAGVKKHKVKPIVKLSVVIAADKNTYDWKKITASLAELTYAEAVLPIEVKVIQNRAIRNENQRPDLSPDKAVKVFLKNHLGNDMEKAKLIYKRSKPYLGFI